MRKLLLGKKMKEGLRRGLGKLEKVRRREKRRELNTFVLVLFLVASFVFGSEVRAVEYEGLSGRPAYPDSEVKNSSSWFIFSLNPGETKQDGIEVINSYDEPKDIVIYAADSTRSSSGGFALKQFSENKEKVGAWVKFFPEELPAFLSDLHRGNNKSIQETCSLLDLKEDLIKRVSSIVKKEVSVDEVNDLRNWCQGKEVVELTLKAGSSVIIPFLFSVPVDVDAGEHRGGILIQKIEPESVADKNGSAIKLTTRLGVRIYQTVPGEVVEKLSIEGFEIKKNFKEWDFKRLLGLNKSDEKEFLVQMKVKNEGNVSLEHESIILIKDLVSGERVAEVKRSFQVLKGDSFVSSYGWKSPKVGLFAISGVIKYKDKDGVEHILETEEVKQKVAPIREIVIASVVVIIILSGCFFYRSRKRKLYGGAGWVEYRAREGDNINLIADMYGVDWKVLAKTNKLKPPYSINFGDIVLVPPFEGSLNKTIERKRSFMDRVQLRIKAQQLKRKATQGLSGLGNRIKGKRQVVLRRSFFKGTDVIVVVLLVFIIGWLVGVTGNSWLTVSPKESGVISIKTPVKNVPERKIGEYRSKLASEELRNVKEVSEKKEDLIADIKVKVLNGVGTPGVAGKVKDKLIERGFEKVTADNAKNYDYQGVVVLYQKDDSEEVAEKVREALKNEHKQVELLKRSSDSDSESVDDSEDEVVVIIGKEG